MSDSTPDWSKMGAHTSPFSGNGMEFLPLGVSPDHFGLVLHESGHVASRPCWNDPEVLARPDIQWLAQKSDAVLRALQHVEENYAQPIYDRTLARMSGLSESAFKRLFRPCQGISPIRL